MRISHDFPQVFNLPLRWLWRLPLALLWLYNGLGCLLPVLWGAPAHALFMFPLLASTGKSALLVIGLLQVAAGLWVLGGKAPLKTAWVQTIALLGIQAGALLFARDTLGNAGGLAVQTLILLTFIWHLALSEQREDRQT